MKIGEQNDVRTTKNIQDAITKCLRRAGRYAPGMQYQIAALASAMHTLTLANAECDKLEGATITNATKEGARTVIHPAIKARQIAEASITQQAKNLGLTMNALMSEVESDPLIDLTRELKEEKNGAVIRPK